MNKKRYNIGVLIGGTHTYFPKEIMKGILLASKELDVNVFFFLGTQTQGFFQDVLGSYQKNTFDYQFNTIYDYALISGLDGIIVSFGTLAIYLNDPDPLKFANKFNAIPTIFLTENLEAPNCHCLISDNYQGICMAVEHLIQVHHCERILFMAGPEGNTDAKERKQAYLDTMERNGLAVTPSMIGHGNYSEFVEKEVEQLLDANRHPQAIVFANDDMAMAGYKVCARRGLVVGRDILFTGYDDSEAATDVHPTLTTVAQNGSEMGRTAVYDMVKMLRKRPVSFRRIPVSFMQRESCGCQHRRHEHMHTSDLIHEVQSLTHTVQRMKKDFTKFQRQSWYIPVIARDLNECMGDETEFCLQVMEKVKELHTKSTYLFLLDPPISYDGIRDWECPDTLRLAAYYRNGRSVSYHPPERPAVSRETPLSSFIEDSERHEFMTFLLFSGETQYGLLLCDIPQEDFSFFYVVSLQIGLSLRYLEISKLEAEQRRAMSFDLERIRKKNHDLDIQSGYDALTGLLNLRGFSEQTSKIRRTMTLRRAYIVYADLDHLKEINDKWGHLEGNFAICSAANILKSCLRSSDLLARIGGDEFLALVTSGSDSFGILFLDRVKKACETLNQKSGKPFYVELSMGVQPFELNPQTDLQQVVSDADKKLYEAKKSRRSTVAR